MDLAFTFGGAVPPAGWDFGISFLSHGRSIGETTLHISEKGVQTYVREQLDNLQLPMESPCPIDVQMKRKDATQTQRINVKVE